MPHQRLLGSLLFTLLAPSFALAQEAPPAPAPTLTPEPPAAPSPPSALSDPAVPAPAAPSSALPASCDREGSVQLAGTSYFPCGHEGVVQGRVNDDGSFLLEARYQPTGVVTSLFLRGDKVWAELTHTDAAPLAQLPRAATVQAGAASPVAQPAVVAVEVAEGDVFAVRDLRAGVSIGTRKGLKNGEHVELYQAQQGADGSTEERTIAIGEVVQVRPDEALVELGLGEQVAAGTLARKTTRRLTANTVMPPRVGGVLLLEASLQPYLPIGTKGIGALADLSVTYLAERPFYARLELRPAGGILSADSEAGVFSGFALLGYDHQYFSLGLGVGMIEADRNSWSGNWEIADTASAKPSLAVKQAARLGARDGLHLGFTNSFVLGGSEWHYATTEVNAQVPVNERTWLTAQAAGGEVGRVARGAVGMRRLVRGNGGSGSLFVHPAVGVVGIARSSGDPVFDTGPMIGCSVEWRK